MDNKIVYTRETLNELSNEVFGDKNKSGKWLATPIQVLNEKIPSSVVESSEGIEEVVEILRKIKTGEFT